VFFSEGVGTGSASDDNPTQPTACEDCGAPASEPGQLAYCNRRFRTCAGAALTAKEVLSERQKLAEDETGACRRNAFFKGFLTQTLYCQVLASQCVRRTRDAGRGIDHCVVVVCSRCLVAPRHVCRSARAVRGLAAPLADNDDVCMPRLSLPADQVAWTAVCLKDDGVENGGMTL
jgi:hypothetical protein